MDHVDEEWELIPSTSPPRHSISTPLFLPPNFYDIQPDYFTCPPATLHHHHQQQQPQDEEGHHNDIDQQPKYEQGHHDDIDQQPKYEQGHHDDIDLQPKDEGHHDDIYHDPIPPTSAELFKDIPISTEFTTKDTTHPGPAPLPAVTPPPFNWLEPDSLAFNCGPDHTSYDMPPSDKELVANRKDCPGFNLWSLGLNGIGAICSFGVATAATLCIFALGAASASGGRLRPSPNIQFQIYSHDKRIKEVVQRATGLNHAISGTRGQGITDIVRAQISFGGHYHYEGAGAGL